MFSKLFSSDKSQPAMEWQELRNLDDLNVADAKSGQKPVVIFKHSTRCPISAMSLNRFESEFNGEATFDPYFLDLIAYRDVSNAIEEKYGVRHESPQAILIVDGKAVFDTSHNAISYKELNQQAKK